MQKLTEAAQVIYEKVAAEAQAEQASASEETGADGDDVVDAEFEEVDPDEDSDK